jgi:hypothetical protein
MRDKRFVTVHRGGLLTKEQHRILIKAVATAHMADHSIGAAIYAQKAVKYLGKSVEAERQWQIEQLSPEIKEMVLNLIEEKENHFKI